MKKDIGFWDINGNYIPDIQELNEIERKEIMETKNFNEFFEELNDMANFKNFGESKEEEIIIDGVDVAGCKYYLFRDKQPAGERSCGVGLIDCNGQNCTYKQLKRLQQENTELKAENERLKEENKLIRQMHKDLMNKLFEFQKVEDTLQEIKAIAVRAFAVCDDDCGNANRFTDILDLITKAEEE